MNGQRALQHRANIDAIEARVRSGDLSEIAGARECLEECTAGIDLLKAGSTLGSREILDVLSQLRLKRADYLGTVIKDGLRRTCTASANNCKQQFEDATAVIDLSPAHSTPEMARRAREHRMAALECLRRAHNGTTGREEKIALEDSRIQLADPDASAEQKAFAAKIAADLKEVVCIGVHVLYEIYLVHDDMIIISHQLPLQIYVASGCVSKGNQLN
jgi:hypothetical protein